MSLPLIRKQNITIPVKVSTSPEGLELKPGELGTDGENLFIGKIGSNFSVTVPIGSIILWLPVAFVDSFNSNPFVLTNEINIPIGWRIANGSKVEDPSSPFDGYYLPNMTSDIFLMGTTTSVAGVAGGTNDSSHKHNIAHHHYTFNGANNIAGKVSTDGSHTHTYYDSVPYSTGGGGEGGGDWLANIGAWSWYRGSLSGGTHTHNMLTLPAGDITTLLVDSSNNLNTGNPRKMDDSADFIENRPRYMEGIYLIKVR